MCDSKVLVLTILLINHGLAVKYSEDWSKKFVSVKDLRLRKLHPVPTLYDPKWAWRVMVDAKKSTPKNINCKLKNICPSLKNQNPFLVTKLFAEVDRNVYSDIMGNHIRFSAIINEDNYAKATSTIYPQIAPCSLKNCLAKKKIEM